MKVRFVITFIYGERGLQRKQKLTQNLSSKKTLDHKVTLVSQCGKERKKENLLRKIA
jgi:hypothetical protein